MVKAGNTALRPVIVEKLSEEARSEIREKLIHLLATKPFGLAELFARLKTDGNVYNLRRNVWYDVKDDWPHYTESEREQMKRRKQQILNPTQISKENAISTDQTRASLTSSIKLNTSQCLPVKRKPEFEKTHYEPTETKYNFSFLGCCNTTNLINNEDYYHPSASSGAAGLPELSENENYYDPKKPKQRISHI
ncbi:unnamed protein product, partial [Ceratitis capitata]